MFIIDVFVYIVNKKLKIIILKIMDNSEIINYLIYMHLYNFFV